MTRINNFVDFRTELVEESSKKAEESSSKRARDKLEQENAKKHKVDDDQEVAELKKCLEIGPDDEDDNGNGPVSVTTDTNGMIKVLTPKTAEEVVARERERKARTTLLMALPEDHLVKFHKIADTEETWKAIKSRFGGNDDLKARDNDTQNYAMMAYSFSNSGSDNESVFMNKESDLENTYVNDRYVDGMHAVPPSKTVDESDSKPSEYASCESDTSVETTTSMPAPVENAPKVVFNPKVWTYAPIIEEYESDSDDDSVKELASPKQTALGKDISNSFMAGRVNTPRCDEDSIELKELMVLCSKLSNRVLALEQSKTAQDLVIKKLQKKVKSIERKIKARTPGMTLFKIGNFRRKSLNKDNVSKQGRYLKTRPMFKESYFDNIDDMVDENND
nr:xylulose kinase-1 [Tanacetum cinerariifolium]